MSEDKITGYGESVYQWRQVILEFESKKEYDNPFLDVRITAFFTGPSGRRIPREAYWDGGCSYKVAFAPTETGTWSWVLEAPKETGLDGLSGNLECGAYTGDLDIYRHGFLKVHPSGRYLIHDDGTPFFWLGDTHWEFAWRESWDRSNHPDMDSMFLGMAKRRVEQGYNVYQTNLRSDKAMGGEERYWRKKDGRDLPNIEFYQNELDRRMIALADLGLVNALGFAWFMSIKDQVDHQKNLARYMVARYGALPVVWTLAGEVAGYGGEPLRWEFLNGWRCVAQYLASIDGYGALKTAHSTNERPFADYYQQEDWFDFTLNQAGHGDYAISPSHYREFRKKYPDKPFIEGEALYEFCSTLEELGTRMCTADMLRRVAYMSIQLGGCGYTYGAQGIWDCVWEKGRENPMALFNRFDVTWYEAIDGAGGRQMGYMKSFYEKIHFWEMLPYTGHGEEDTALFAKKSPLIIVNEERTRAAVYYGDTCRKGAVAGGMKPGRYRLWWFDPRTGKETEERETEAEENGNLKLPAKRGDGDWLLAAERLR